MDTYTDLHLFGVKGLAWFTCEISLDGLQDWSRKNMQWFFTHESCETISRKISCLVALQDKIVLILAKPHRDLARPTSSFLVVAGNSFRCYLLIYHTSCAVVSVFWLWQEIVFGCTVSKKDSYLVSSIERESTSKCVYFVRSNTLLLCISLLCIYLLYHTDPGLMWPSGLVTL